MSSEGAPPRHDPFAALRLRDFQLFTCSRFAYGIATTLLQTVILWQVYDISESALNLGLLGLVRFFPAVCLGLVGGAFADAYNRRTIIMVTQTVPLLCSIVLSFATFNGWVTLELIYAMVFLMGLAAAFEGPARAAILPAIVPPQVFTNAVTVSSTVQSLSFVTGPVLGGGLIALAGIGSGYALFTVLSAIAIVTMGLVRYRPSKSAEERRAVSVAAIREGVGFVARNPVLLGAMTLDMFAVIFGGAKALLPIYAKDILDAGATGFGLLNASLEIGAFAMSFLLLMRPPVVRTGRALVLSVVVFGLGTIVFGLSRDLYLSAFVYMLIGCADQISVVMRTTTIQLATPDELRGRVSAVNQIFIQSSNQLGGVESGLVAAATSATFAVVSGGVGAMAVAGAVHWRVPQLSAYEAPVRRPAVEPEPEADKETAVAG